MQGLLVSPNTPQIVLTHITGTRPGFPGGSLI
jgi:hypothetical protein